MLERVQPVLFGALVEFSLYLGSELLHFLVLPEEMVGDDAVDIPIGDAGV